MCSRIGTAGFVVDSAALRAVSPAHGLKLMLQRCRARVSTFHRPPLESGVCERRMETLIRAGRDPVIPTMWLWDPQTRSNSLPLNCKCASRATARIHTIHGQHRPGSDCPPWTRLIRSDRRAFVIYWNPDTRSAGDHTFWCEKLSRSEMWSEFKVDEDYGLSVICL